MADSQQTKFIQFCIQFSSLALVYYDYVLTFGREVEHVWYAPFKLCTVLYYCCRYSLVANVVYALVLDGSLLPVSCDIGYKISSVLSVLGRTTITLIWGIRCYVMFGGSRIILAVFGPLGLTVVVLSAIHVPSVTCSGEWNDTIVSDLLSTFTVAYEVLLTVCTTFRAVQALEREGSWKEQRDSLMFLLFHQGILYFVTVTGFTITATILNYTEPNGSFTRRLLNAFTNPISGIMTARFLLYLRAWHKKSTHTSCSLEDRGGIRIGSIRSAVGNFVNGFGDDPVGVGQREILP